MAKRNPVLVVKNAGYGKTPEVPDSKFRRGDVVKIRRLKALAGFPRKAVVLCALPPGFPPEYALADLMGEPRPLMVTQGRRCVSYILVNEGDSQSYIATDKHLIASGEPPIEIGSVQRGPD